jgi:hypothetical protein
MSSHGPSIFRLGRSSSPAGLPGRYAISAENIQIHIGPRANMRRSLQTGIFRLARSHEALDLKIGVRLRELLS